MVEKGLADLLESNLRHAEKFQDSFDQVQDSQQPDYVTICCSDSRVLQDHMWGNQHPGKIFTCSNIGNRVFQDTENGKAVSGDVLYPVKHTETDTVIVVGHTGCGAVTATYKDLETGLEEPEGIRHSINLLKPEIRKGKKKLGEGLTEQQKINRLVEYNVDAQVDFLLNSEEIAEEKDVIGVVYDFQDIYTETRGKIHVVNVNGENRPEKLKEQHEEIKERVNRLWTP